MQQTLVKSEAEGVSAAPATHVEMIASETKQYLSDLANQEQLDDSLWVSFRKYPRASLWCLFACWVLTLSGFENQAGGAVIGVPRFRQDFGRPFEDGFVLPASWQSAFNAAPAATAIAGSLGSAWIGDRIGRRLTLALAISLSIASITMEIVATHRDVFLGGKLLNGLAVGTFGALMPGYIGEITPLACRGFWTCCIGVAYGIGPLIAFIIINYTGQIDSAWAYRAVICSQYGLVGIVVLFLPFMPESPWWLVRTGKRDRALKNLSKLGYRGHDGEKELAMIETTLEQIKTETEGATYLECFRRSNLRRTMISVAPLIIQSITGIQFVAGYFTYYLQLAGYSTDESFKIQVAQPVVSIVGNLMAAFLIERVGRRDLTFWGLALLVVFLFITGGLATGGSFSEIRGTVAMILLYSWMYNVSLGSTAFTILSETATSRLRVKTVAIGISSQGAINVMWQFVIPFMFNPDQGNLGGKVAFVFGGPSFLCLLYLWFQQPETAGRTYEELDEMFAKRVPAREFKKYRAEASIRREAVKEITKKGQV